ncbi:MAG: hypothetical protein KAS32_05145 [Candidatus Peribacteraceae bacterium]|nr:hypothetical protein [Candidatus Peribacteraceae bacterium]
MTKMYRPEGWNAMDIMLKTPVYVITGDELTDIKLSLVEAGADAMLEGLKKEGMNSKGEFPNIKQFPNDSMLTVKIPNKKGWLVFIPEEAKP